VLSLREMRQHICVNHYLHSIPSGETIFTQYEDAIIVFSRPANPNISNWLLGQDNAVWELSRMWAPDGHRKNLLTEAIAACTGQFSRAAKRLSSGECHALVSYADPHAGHSGGVYRAASWQYLGQVDEGRCYVDGAGVVTSRRAFHKSERNLTKAQILELGFVELHRPGKHRFAKGLSKWARRQIKTHPLALGTR